MFHIVVGQLPHQREFGLPQDIFQEISYFAGLPFRGNETSKNKVTLDDGVDDPYTFEMVFKYLSTKPYP
jgi:hypothetical protein